MDNKQEKEAYEGSLSREQIEKAVEGTNCDQRITVLKAEIMSQALEIAKKNSQMVGRREIGFIDLEQLNKLIKGI